MLRRSSRATHTFTYKTTTSWFMIFADIMSLLCEISLPNCSVAVSLFLSLSLYISLSFSLSRSLCLCRCHYLSFSPWGQPNVLVQTINNTEPSFAYPNGTRKTTTSSTFLRWISEGAPEAMSPPFGELNCVNLCKYIAAQQFNNERWAIRSHTYYILFVDK